MKLSYRYNYETFVFEEVCDTPLDPLETEKAGHDVWMLGACCTYKEPPAAKDGYNIVFNVKSDDWEYHEIKKTEAEQAPPTTEEVIRNKICEYEDYLCRTDWYITRFVETGAVVPEEIKQRRQEARAMLSQLKSQ